MKAALVRTEDHTLCVAEIPEPEPGPGEVLVKVAYCGVCGTDLHMLSAGGVPAECIMGHEVSGQVSRTREGVKGWTEGDPVVVRPIDFCMSCAPCRKGDTNLCQQAAVRTYGLGFNPGGFSQLMRVKPSMLHRAPDGKDMKVAALAEPLAVALHAVNRGRVTPGEHILVMGAGPIGLLMVYVLKARGAGKVFVSEPDSHRARQAVAAGADFVLDPGRQDPGHEIIQIASKPPDCVFDCAGTEQSMEAAGSITGPHGRVVVVGLNFSGHLTLYPMTWFSREISATFSLAYSTEEFSESIHMLARGDVDASVVVSDIVPLSRIGTAFSAAPGPGGVKILVDCQDV